MRMGKKKEKTKKKKSAHKSSRCQAIEERERVLQSHYHSDKIIIETSNVFILIENVWAHYIRSSKLVVCNTREDTAGVFH